MKNTRLDVVDNSLYLESTVLRDGILDAEFFFFKYPEGKCCTYESE